jgi:hypothetical protein
VDHGGALGLVLHVLQQRHAGIEAFHGLLTNAVGQIQERAPRAPHRLVELLAYLTALVYHFRNEQEHASLRDDLERSIDVQPIRREIRAMGRTIAEALREEGKRKGRREGKREGVVEGKQETLVFQLRRKFGRRLTPAITAVIEGTREVRTLDGWLGNVLDADTLEDVGIPG